MFFQLQRLVRVSYWTWSTDNGYGFDVKKNRTSSKSIPHLLAGHDLSNLSKWRLAAYEGSELNCNWLDFPASRILLRFNRPVQPWGCHIAGFIFESEIKVGDLQLEYQRVQQLCGDVSKRWRGLWTAKRLPKWRAFQNKALADSLSDCDILRGKVDR